MVGNDTIVFRRSRLEQSVEREEGVEGGKRDELVGQRWFRYIGKRFEGERDENREKKGIRGYEEVSERYLMGDTAWLEREGIGGQVTLDAELTVK